MIMLAAGSTDRQLLDNYVHEQDSAAFRDLVSRHGSAVHRVCRGVLKDIHEAEDAFQATFLVLARRAPEIRDPEALGGWLRGVAYRVAIRARRRVGAAAGDREGTGRDVARGAGPRAGRSRLSSCEELVGDELTRLPDDYRRPIVLCYLDGLTHQEAARRLDWPVGTVKVRLVRGRRMLRERLHRRGVALGAALLADALAGPAGVRGHRAAGGIDGPGHVPGQGRPPRRAASASSRAPASWPMRRGGSGSVLRYPWLWAALVVVAVSLALSGPVARALGGPPVSEVDPSTLPGNLTDVLNVECR